MTLLKALYTSLLVATVQALAPDVWNPVCLQQLATNSSEEAESFFNSAFHPRTAADFVANYFESGPFVLRRRTPEFFKNLISLDGTTLNSF